MLVVDYQSGCLEGFYCNELVFNPQTEKLEPRCLIRGLILGMKILIYDHLQCRSVCNRGTNLG